MKNEKEIPKELEPKPLLSRFLLNADRKMVTQQGEYTNGKWLLKPEYTPQKLKEKMGKGEKDKPSSEFLYPIDGLQLVSNIQGYIKDNIGGIIYIVKTKDGQKIGIAKPYYDYLKKHIPSFNLKGNSPIKPLVIYSGDKEAGLLMPKTLGRER